MKKRFVVFIDFSEHSGDLLRFASDWANIVHAELLVVHQLTVLTPMLTDQDDKKQLKSEEKGEALKQMMLLGKDIAHPGQKISYQTIDYDVRLFLHQLEEEPYDHLLFVGLNGNGLLKQVFIGSFALKVIESGNHMVVAIPNGLKTVGREKILIGVTPKHTVNILRLNNFLNMIRNEHTTLTFFYLAKAEENTVRIEQFLNDLLNLFRDKIKTEYKIYLGSNQIEHIKSIISESDKELLIIQKGSRLLSDQLFRKFLVNDLVHDGKIPLVILP